MLSNKSEFDKTRKRQREVMEKKGGDDDDVVEMGEGEEGEKVPTHSLINGANGAHSLTHSLTH